MTTREMTAEEHVSTSLTLLEQSEREFAAGDIIQGSEKLWGAASHAVMAVAKRRGWPTGSHRNLTRAADRLSEEQDDKALALGFSVAEIFHRSFYGHGYFDPFAETDPVSRDRALVAHYVHRVLEIAGESA